MTESWDFIIIGAGSSGCALAHRLSEHGSVLLLERGGPDVSANIHDPAGVVAAIFAEPETSVPYPTTPQAALNQPDGSGAGRVVGIHRGVVRGGCSSINGMIYVRGHRRNYDEWAALGNDGWSYDDVLPYFRRSEDHASGASEYHGSGGPLHVRPIPDPSPVSHAFVDAAASLDRFPGSRYDADLNRERQEDLACHYDVTVTAEGTRASAAVAFLDPIRERPGLTVRLRSRVSRILVDRGRAIGVEVIGADGFASGCRADREVIVAAGALESPRLLMRSGIGPADHLRAHGVRVVHDRPGVGENLQDHLMLLLYVVAAEGAAPGTSGFIAEAGLFTNVNGGDDAPPDLQYHFLAGMKGLAVDPETTPNFLFCPALIQPKSRGRVRLRSSDPSAPPVVDPGYLSDPADVEVLVRGIELARELKDTAPLSDFAGDGPLFAMVPDPADPLGRPPIRIDVPASGREGIEALVRAAATTVWHPCGTCRMGADDEAVVDAALRVKGVDGLRVADASIMPRIPGGDTNAPCIMIGEKAADLVLSG